MSELLAAYSLGMLGPILEYGMLLQIVLLLLFTSVLPLFFRKRLAVFLFAAGLAFGHISASPPAYLGQLPRKDCSCQAKLLVCSLPTDSGMRRFANLELNAIRCHGEEWKPCNGKVLGIFPVETELDYGDIIEAEGGLLSFRESDAMKGYYRTAGIWQSFHSRLIISKEEARGWRRQWKKFLHSRERLSEILTEGIEDAVCAGMYSAMMLGMRNQMDAETREQFIKSASVHLFSISGLHVGILCLALYRIMKALNVPLRLRALSVLPLLLLYVLLTGAAPSAERSFIMAAGLALACLLLRKGSAENALALSGFLLLLLNPLYLKHTGFLFSFTLVFVLLRSGKSARALVDLLCEKGGWLPADSARRRLWRRCAMFCAAVIGGLAAWLGCSGLMMYCNSMLSPGSFLINLLLAPVAGILVSAVIPKLLLHVCLPMLSIWLGRFLQWLLKGLLFVSAIGAADGMYISCPQLPFSAGLLYYLLLFIAISGPRPWKVRLLALCAAMGILLCGACQGKADSGLLCINSPYQNHAGIVLLGQEHPVILQCGDKATMKRLLDELSRLGMAQRVDICITDGAAAGAAELISAASPCSAFFSDKALRSAKGAELLGIYRYNGVHCIVGDEGRFNSCRVAMHRNEMFVYADNDEIRIGRREDGITEIEAGSASISIMPALYPEISFIPLDKKSPVRR